MWILNGLFVIIGIIISYIMLEPLLMAIMKGTIPNLTDKKFLNVEFDWFEPWGVIKLIPRH